MLERFQMVELHLFQLPQNQVFSHHLMLKSTIFSDFLFQQSLWICSTSNFNVQFRPSFYFFKTKYFLLKSYILNKYSCHHVY